MRKIVADHLQALYEHNHVPETWGSASVSGQTFETLRKDGFAAAARYLFQRLHEVGQPGLSPAAKFLALVTGVGLVALVNSFLHTFTQERRPEVKAHGQRKFSAHTPAFAIALYVLGAALLVTANEEQGGGGGGGSGGSGQDYDWDSSSEYKAYARPGEGDGREGGVHDPEYDDFDPDDDRPYGDS